MYVLTVHTCGHNEDICDCTASTEWNLGNWEGMGIDVPICDWERVGVIHHWPSRHCHKQMSVRHLR